MTNYTVFCPHCGQDFPETSEEYLGTSVECPACQNDFVCEKPKFCSECGAPNPAKAMECVQCGKSFAVLRIKQVNNGFVPPSVQEERNPYCYTPYSAPVRKSPPAAISGWDKFCITFVDILGALWALGLFGILVDSIKEQKFIITIIVILCGFIDIYSCTQFGKLKKPGQRIVMTPFRMLILTVLCIVSGLGVIETCIIAITSESFILGSIIIPLSVFFCYGCIRGTVLFVRRAKEDNDY